MAEEESTEPTWRIAEKARESELDQVRYTHICENHDADYGCWPETNTTRSEVKGELAQRCRVMLGVDDESADVFITEVENIGGWSEITTETDWDCKVECAGKTWETEGGWDNGLVQLLTVLDRSEEKDS